MMKLLRILSVSVVLFLCACDSLLTEERNTDYVGRYELVRIEGGSADEGISEEEVRQLKEYDLICALDIREDGTAVMNNYGEEEQFVWNNNGLTYNESGETISFEADGKMIIIRDEDTLQALIFMKIE